MEAIDEVGNTAIIEGGAPAGSCLLSHVICKLAGMAARSGMFEFGSFGITGTLLL